MQSSTKYQENAKASASFNFLDGVSCLSAVGGAIASLVLQQAAFAAIPLSVALSLQVLSRKKMADKMMQYTASSLSDLGQVQTTQSQTIDSLGAQCAGLKEMATQLSQDQSKTSLSSISLQGHCTENQKAIEGLSEQVAKIDEVLTVLKEITSSSGKIEAQMSAAEAYFERGTQQEELGHFEAAIADYTSAIQQSANYAEAYFSRGKVKAGLGLKQSAVADLNTSAKYFFEQGNLDRYQQAKDACAEIHNQARVDSEASKAASPADQSKKEPELASINGLFG